MKLLILLLVPILSSCQEICTTLVNNPALREATTFFVKQDAIVTCDGSTVCDDGLECSSILNVCVPASFINLFPVIMPSCLNEQNKPDCPLSYRLIDGECHFVGPRLCRSHNDCHTGQECVDISSHTGLSGMRCFQTCGTDDICRADAHQTNPKKAAIMRRMMGCTRVGTFENKFCTLKRPISRMRDLIRRNLKEFENQ